MSEPYKPRASWFAKQGEKYLGTPYSQMDCQAFVEKCLKDVGVNKDWKGSNAMWRDMAWTGTPEEAKKAFGGTPAGAFLFIVENDGGEIPRGYHDGQGNASHVGICTNTGQGAIHSSSSRGMVAESKYKGRTIPNGGWNRVGLCKLLDYEMEEPEKTEETKVDGMIDLYVHTGGNGTTANLRKKPSLKGDLIGRVSEGELVFGEPYNDQWSRVKTTDGKRGYMMSKYLTLPEDYGVQVTDQQAPAVEDLVTIQVPRSVAEIILKALERSVP
ncbi:MAG: SH3 domain-containing protein [Clostridia bacterium]|nr:SH3 domain-containing protein [Clostridia bacterium]